TWFDFTRFKTNGYQTLTTTPSGGAFPVVLQVQEDTSVEDMQLLTPVVHTIELSGVGLDTNSPFLDVTIVNTSDSNAALGKTRMHKDDADDSSMPPPKMKHPMHGK